MTAKITLTENLKNEKSPMKSIKINPPKSPKNLFELRERNLLISKAFENSDKPDEKSNSKDKGTKILIAKQSK